MPTQSPPAQRKSLTVEFKDNQEGSFRARFSTLKVVDKDGDVTLPGAFTAGKEILISAYGHASWMGALPVGKGTIGANGSEAWVDGQFFLDTTAGMDTYRTVKALGGLQEWSYGYDVKASSNQPVDLEAYPGAQRILKTVEVYEASPVLIGAGVNTGTEFVKSMSVPYADHAETVLATIKAWADRSQELASLRAKDGRGLSTANRDRLKALLTALHSISSDVDRLLDPPKDEELEAIWLASQQRQADLRQSELMQI